MVSRRELKDQVREYRRARKDLSGELSGAVKLCRTASTEFEHEVESWKAAHKRRRLLNTSLIELEQQYGNVIKASLLASGGIRTASTLLRTSTFKLEEFRGVGPVTANKIRAAIEHFAHSLSTERVPLPDLHSDASAEVKLLKVTIAHFHARKLLDSSSRLEGELQRVGGRSSRMSGQIWFLGAASRERLRETVGLASEEVSRISLLAKDEGITHKVNGLKIMRALNPKGVRAAWTSRSIDYLVLLERELGSADVLAAHLIPDELRDKIEALELELDGLECTLRRYQEFGTKFALVQRRILLGDDMGLGKTIQALAVFEHLNAAESLSRLLVVCPASLIENWRSEIEDKCSLEPHVLHGSEKLLEKRNWLDSGGIAITSFSTLRGDSLALDIDLDAIVVDEAHYVKNPEAYRTEATRLLIKRSDVVMLMTGTPLENRFNEFAQLLEFVSPGISDGLRSLGYESRAAVTEDVVAKQIANVYLRRNKEEVLHELPDLIESETWVRLSSSQQSAYSEAVYSGNFMAMRRATVVGPNSSKYRVLSDIIDEYKEAGRKVLVFSYFRQILDDVVSQLDAAYLINGSVAPKKRMQVIGEFKEASGHAVLVSQIMVGGVGLNLQEASAVIFMEPQLKPSTEWQALSRAHRMGQTETVVVHRLLARDCIDEIVNKLLARKARLFAAYAARSDTADEFSESRDGEDMIGAKKMAEIVEQERQRLSSVVTEPNEGLRGFEDSLPHATPVAHETMTQQIDTARQDFWTNKDQEPNDG